MRLRPLGVGLTIRDASSFRGCLKKASLRIGGLGLFDPDLVEKSKTPSRAAFMGWCPAM